ncbi:FecR family protein [Mucilaginibacter sp. AW1-3]
MMMHDDRIMQLLARKVAGEATRDELRELGELLELYPDNLYYEEVLKQLWDQQPIADTDNDVEAAYLKHKEKYSEEFFSAPAPRIRKLLIRRMLVAASVLILAVSGLVFYRAIKSSPEKASVYTEITATANRKKIVLPDGTQVWLNTNSKIGFDGNMNNNPVRLVHLTGEAFFDVTKNKHRPFIVHTEKFSIKVLGTAFNVKAYPGDKKAEAALIRGMIELTINDSLQEKLILRPNEKFAMAYSKPVVPGLVQPNNATRRKLVVEDIKPIEIGRKEYIEEISWVDNQLVFKNQSLEELVPRLEKWYNVKIAIENDKVKNYHFTGVLQNESLTQALTAMQIIRPFTFKIDKYDVKIN